MLDATGKESRKTQALLRSAQVLSLAGRVLTLGFPSGQLVRMFEEGTNAAVLSSALGQVLGLEVDLKLAVGTDAPAPVSAPAAAAPAAPPPPPAPEYEGLAPGDEIEPVDPDEPEPERAVLGEDAALALLQDQLGGTVIDES